MKNGRGEVKRRKRGLTDRARGGWKKKNPLSS